jgi:signal transduction histidine kinase
VKNILLNLLSNAIKFSPENGLIELNIANKRDVLHISIKDSGIGISEEDQVHLFSSFYRGRNAVNIQGTGLGLHIVKRYVDILQGTISLKSKIGEGTIVSLQLPKIVS